MHRVDRPEKPESEEEARGQDHAARSVAESLIVTGHERDLMEVGLHHWWDTTANWFAAQTWPTDLWRRVQRPGPDLPSMSCVQPCDQRPAVRALRPTASGTIHSCRIDTQGFGMNSCSYRFTA